VEQLRQADARTVNAEAASGRMIALAGPQEASWQQATIASERAITNHIWLQDSVSDVIDQRFARRAAIAEVHSVWSPAAFFDKRWQDR